MPITATAGAPIRGAHTANARQRTVAQTLINKLQYSEIWRGATTLHEDKDANIRLDKQGTTTSVPKQHNLQIQHGNLTIAHANVSESVHTDDPTNQRGVVNKVIGALNQSMDTSRSYTVAGSIP